MSVETQIDTILRDNNQERALVLIKEYVDSHPDDGYTLFCLGKLWWRMGERAKATSCYARSVAIDPDGPAKAALEMARSIEDFFNPDLLNP